MVCGVEVGRLLLPAERKVVYPIGLSVRAYFTAASPSEYLVEYSLDIEQVFCKWVLYYFDALGIVYP